MGLSRMATKFISTRRFARSVHFVNMKTATRQVCDLFVVVLSCRCAASSLECSTLLVWVLPCLGAITKLASASEWTINLFATSLHSACHTHHRTSINAARRHVARWAVDHSLAWCKK